MSASPIYITGLATNDPVPGIYPEINFAQGAASGNSTAYEACLIGNKTTAGTATAGTVIYGPDTVVPMQTEQDVKTLFGAGSELHIMWRAFTRVNKSTTLRAIVVAESGGTAASGTITIATTATASGNLRVWVGREFVDVAIATGDTATVIGDALAAAVNAMDHWPVTATNGSGTVTLLAKIKGPRGNQIRIMGAIQSSGTIATTVSPTADTALTSGATADTNATALSTLSTHRHYYLVSAAGDATQLGALATQVNTQAMPITNQRQRVFAGAVGTLSASNAIAVGINNPRVEITWSERSDMTEAELAANAAAIYSLGELNTDNPRTNYIGYGNTAKSAETWFVPAPRDASYHPSRTSIKSALNNGLSPIGVNANGSTYLVDRITTRSLSGSIQDYRIRDAHKVTICDLFADELCTKLALNHSEKRIADEPGEGEKFPGRNVLIPSIARADVNGLLDKFASNDLLQSVETIKSETVVQRESSPTTRMGIRVPLRPIDNVKQFAVAIDQVA